MNPEILVVLGFPERIELTCPKCKKIFAISDVRFDCEKNRHQVQLTILEGSQIYRCQECGTLIRRCIRAHINTELAKGQNG